MIYFVRPVGMAGPVKIGHSLDVERRLNCLQAGSPVRLMLVALMDGDPSNESLLHYRFAEQRLHGEWFKPCRDLDELISRHAIVPPLTAGAGHRTGRAARLITKRERAWLNNVSPARWMPAEDAA